jgi:hypothetical protein
MLGRGSSAIAGSACITQSSTTINVVVNLYRLSCMICPAGVRLIRFIDHEINARKNHKRIATHVRDM